MRITKLSASPLLAAFVLLGCHTGARNSESNQAAASASGRPTPSPALAAALGQKPQAAQPGPQDPPPALPNAIPAPADVAEPPADAPKTPSGLASKVLTKGTGKEHPGAHDKVRVHYTGWTKDGRMFDSSVARGESIVFPLDHVIKGWGEGLALMVTGEKRRLWIPAGLAYGNIARGGAPTGDLTFDVELLEVMAAPPAPAVPEDVAAAPASAKKTASGLAYKVLKAGVGANTPKLTDRVSVNYSGWTPDGKMFDSSIVRGEPVTFPVGGVIKGWTEALQLMKVGDKVRLWIPSDLAYGDKPQRPGAPAGPLVFDVELLGIK